jgi:hypothetical protein
MSTKETSLSVISIIGIIAASVAVVTLEELGIFGMAQAQGNLTSELTPEQKAAVCASVG